VSNPKAQSLGEAARDIRIAREHLRNAHKLLNGLQGTTRAVQQLDSIINKTEGAERKVKAALVLATD
jgi:hypothetical protein